MRGYQEVGIDSRELLDRWVERGLIRQEQADRIRSEEDWEAPPATSTAVAQAGGRGSLIVEALGYLGGISWSPLSSSPTDIGPASRPRAA
jgi:hypothetical protein